MNANRKSAAPWNGFSWGTRTFVMGVLNVTPDSFSDGGRFLKPAEALEQARRMKAEGAELLDVGAESTRPGATPVEKGEEWRRLEVVLDELQKERLPPLSIDTQKASIARKALARGVRLVNDIWGLQGDPEMAEVIASHSAGVIVMHNQAGTKYAGSVIDAILRFFERSLEEAARAGIPEDHIVLDPGIGFGKTVDQNLEVLAGLSLLRSLGFPLLLGVSRKSLIGKTLDLPVEERVEGTLALNVIGVVQGVDIIRVHDVAANLRAVRMADAVYRKDRHG